MIEQKNQFMYDFFDIEYCILYAWNKKGL